MLPTDPAPDAASPAVGAPASARRARWVRRALLALFLGAIAAWLVMAFREASGLSGLTAELRDRGRVAVVGDAGLLDLEVDGTTLVAASRVAGLDRALRGTSFAEVERSLRAAGMRGILVRTDLPHGGASVLSRLERYAPAPPLGGVYLAPDAALYERVEVPDIDRTARDAIAHVARRILMGARPPAFRSFPAEMRRDMGIEVMVLVRERSAPLLWRSARRGSLARGVVDAALAARDRWSVRESFLGGPIETRLPALSFELHAVVFDGRIGNRSAPFFRSVLRLGEHGVGFERRGDWRYVLPEIARAHARGEAVGAVRALLADNGLPTDDLERPEIVLYRFTLLHLATSPPERAATARP